MFENKTYEALLAEALASAPANVDTRQGSIYRDALTGPLLALAQFYVDLDHVISLTRVDSAPDEYLDDRGEEFAVIRQAATCARYEAILVGTPPAEGVTFIIEDQLFDIYYDEETGAPYFEAVEPGVGGNTIQIGAQAAPVSIVEGLVSATVGNQIEPGTDKQSDADYRQRIQERISGPAENGNKQHYKTWCESVSGVGHAKIVPLWNGPNTVKGIIYGDDGLPASDAVVERVQNYVDPDEDGDGMGDGLGEGVAEIGAHFTAVKPGTVPITVSVSVQLANGYTLNDAREELHALITQYLKDVVAENKDNMERPIIRYNAIGSIVIESDAVLDYSDLLLNGATANIQHEADEVAILEDLNIAILD